MVEKTEWTLDAHRLAREQQRRVTAATAIGLNALKASYAVSGLDAEAVKAGWLDGYH